MSSANNKGRMSRRKKMEPWYYVGPIFLLLVINLRIHYCNTVSDICYYVYSCKQV